ncbi:MAG TPA: DUF72 domain-containing protein [Candidatus Polarisedimenticolia bacterium]|nr:DUF72 domain-containing protein [Candidatus Polarisedimenticolia bacterium]
MGDHSTGFLRVGTSGWAYRHWADFYGPEIRPPGYLARYAREFPTVEVNNSFYHLPLPSTYEKWARETPPGFVFALKLSRYITHIRRLRAVKRETRRFLVNALPLTRKRGPLLVQLPPSFQADPRRLAQFIDATRDVARDLELRPSLRLAFEFRHESWFQSEETRRVLEDAGAVAVSAHSTRYPGAEEPWRTASWVYLRFHGPRELFASEYGEEALQAWGLQIRGWLREGSDVYAYFNNDARGYALRDATRLLAMASPSTRAASSARSRT